MLERGRAAAARQAFDLTAAGQADYGDVIADAVDDVESLAGCVESYAARFEARGEGSGDTQRDGVDFAHGVGPGIRHVNPVAARGQGNPARHASNRHARDY
jgi:hypothetical protein